MKPQPIDKPIGHKLKVRETAGGRFIYLCSCGAIGKTAALSKVATSEAVKHYYAALRRQQKHGPRPEELVERAMPDEGMDDAQFQHLLRHRYPKKEKASPTPSQAPIRVPR